MINDHQAGFVFENGDDAALLGAARDLIVSLGLRKHYGGNARQFFESYFSVESAADEILNDIEG